MIRPRSSASRSRPRYAPPPHPPRGLSPPCPPLGGFKSAPRKSPKIPPRLPQHWPEAGHAVRQGRPVRPPRGGLPVQAPRGALLPARRARRSARGFNTSIFIFIFTVVIPKIDAPRSASPGFRRQASFAAGSSGPLRFKKKSSSALLSTKIRPPMMLLVREDGSFFFVFFFSFHESAQIVHSK